MLRRLRAPLFGLACLVIAVAIAAMLRGGDDPGQAIEPEPVIEFAQAVEPPSDAEAVPANRWAEMHALRSETQRGIIRHFFRGRRDGVFVDVGSAHYRDLSMTYFLEKEFGWSGIAIDALEQWRPGYTEHRPRTRFFTYIVTDHQGAKEPFYRLKGGIGSTALKERADMLESEWSSEVTEILVPTITLNALLDEASVTRIDFLSMDIEGAEPIALAGFDIERFRPELVGIEVFPENREAILEYFQQHGYHRIDAYLETQKSDWFFTCNVRSECTSK